MAEEAVPLAEVRVAHGADMRYVGQAYELTVPIAAPVSAVHLPALAGSFHVEHERVYGYARRGQPVEFVNFRATHTYPLPPPVLRSPSPAGGSLASAQVGERRAHFAPGGWAPTAIFDRARLPGGARLPGPAIVEQPDTTTVIPPGHVAIVEASGNLRIRRAP
jgi:N-methylhydantoinase A